MCIRKQQKSHLHTLKILWSMSVGGLWKHKKNPAGIRRVTVFIQLKLDTVKNVSLFDCLSQCLPTQCVSVKRCPLNHSSVT